MANKLDKALVKAKIGIMINGSVFLSTLIFNLRHVFTKDEVPTAATDGISVTYNEDFFEKLTPEERIGLIAHEAWHVALTHMTRRGDRDHQLYNRAGDYVINQLLVDSNFQIPANGCQNDKYRGMTTNQVYELIKEDPNEKPDQNNTDVIYISNNPDKSKQQGNSKDPVTGQQMGKKELEAHIEGILVKAATQAKMQGEQAGAIPGEIQRLIDKLINPILPWESILQRFITEKVKNDYSWARPNKRFMPDFYLPTQYSESLSKLTFCIDTSGSISTKDLQKILSEIQYIRDTMKPSEMEIIDCDREIHN